ncbi:MAG: MEKHLA domain-containing protein [Elainellaceae cyanobacterium]
MVNELGAAPNDRNHYHADHVALIRESYRRRLGWELLPGDWSKLEAAKMIYEGPFVVVSHNTATDPIFNYANRIALDLFEMTWAEFTALPSRCSAEPPTQTERSRLLAEVTANGFIDHYSGVRASKTGKRFEIQNVKVWNLAHPDGTYAGQAAAYSDWTFL